MSNELIFTANVGNEILYNNESYIFSETNLYNKNEIDTISGLQYSHIRKPGYTYDNNYVSQGNSKFYYPDGVEMSSYKYGWKQQGIECDDPIAPDNFISPKGIFCRPLHLKQVYRADNGQTIDARYEVTSWDKQYWTAPKSGILRAIFGIYGTDQNRFHFDSRYDSNILAFNRGFNVSPTAMPYTMSNDLTFDREYVWINDEPYWYGKSGSPGAFKFESIYFDINRFYSYAVPIPVNEGDKVYYHGFYARLTGSTHPTNNDKAEAEYDFTDVSDPKYKAWFMNGIFYPYEP